MIKFLPLLLIIISCSTAIPKEEFDSSFSVIYKSEIGGADKAGHILIQDNETYIKFIESLKLDESKYANFLKVDFKKKDVLVLYQGQKTSGGYSIDIESVLNENHTIFIKKKETEPKKGEMTTSVITSPYCISLIPKGKKIIVE
ncbi:protease complex subunit PrcB family protein [Flavobacterium lacisediminis]|uniref:Protease complex subunit PrcB family protein n=1 Tax=Flavobacterium lacisediminis TaxID=2989705 RepID=A0ABT3EKS0_9FLAO|nr:protease complex subunit PrcB family protein [Flavobacterium lacisediminis]MCW1148724.1 protease complex subunit PrcB family protein [Flavobacterium lacisediminis]